jgi:hypothetical protein
MTSADLLTDAFDRIRETVRAVAGDLTPDQLAFRVEADANPISWLIWHLTRVQDDHVAAAFGAGQVWVTGKWAARFGLPEETMEIGYGHSSSQVAAITGAVSAADLLIDYHEATYQQTRGHVSRVTDADLDRIVDRSWNPPVTLSVRLISVINDDMQHAGQAAFVRGCLLRRARA